MGQTQTDKGMVRREFLGWLCKISGGTAAVSLGGGLLPLRKINTVMLSDARAATCAEDTCSTLDSGGVCTTRDVCDSDGSLDCTNDQCTADSSGACTDDECVSDKSAECTGDRCESDSSGACENDGGPACPEDDSCSEDYIGCRDDYSGTCQSDSSGDCKNDSCKSDSSGECSGDICQTDSSKECQTDFCKSDGSATGNGDDCVSDSSGECTGDWCISDKSGECTTDRCISDSSGACKNDVGPACPEDDSCPEDYVGCRDDFGGNCGSDSSGACQNDSCKSDSSGECSGDICSSDSSQGCGTDFCIADSSGAGDGDDCVADSSGECASDYCISDSAGDCGKDSCASDSSGECSADECSSDSSGGCKSDACTSDSSADCTTDYCSSDSSQSGNNDSCTADSSGACFTSDVCVRDVSYECTSDLCRDDRSGSGCETDTCGLDLASSRKTSRREFAKTSLNQALKMLYKLASVILVLGLLCGGQARADINASDAAFSPAADFVTEGTVNVPDPVGPFLRDCDDDGILEADVNGDGLCAGDPELRDYNSDGNLELPEETEFSGSFEFTCFYIPYNAVIIATGPLTVAASDEFAVFGAVRLPGGGTFSCQADIDLHTSAWLAEAGAISFTTATAGPVLTDPESDLTDEVPPVDFISICSSPRLPTSIPTLSEWGLLLMMILMIGSALAMIRCSATHTKTGNAA